MRTKTIALCGLAVWILLAGCDPLDHSQETGENPDGFTLKEVAGLLSTLPVGTEQLQEVADAVGESLDNGYDEEYMMRDLFGSPGTGVGAVSSRAERKTYGRPLRALLEEAVRTRFSTRSDPDSAADAFLAALGGSDVQIYWPFSREWDGTSMPVVTFDPLDGSDRNVGYTFEGDTVLVDEKTARERPVWVVNRNDDSAYKSLELRRREDPSWGEGGGSLYVRSEVPVKTLVLKSFRAKRHYDTWFAGASEFFIKCGAVEDFTATTEAELALYSPTVTDFMIVVKRDQIGETIPFNAVLVSDWTGQLDQIALMMTEDDGGSQTTWKCSATVKYNSKAYGFDLQIPLNERDDIVWRGQLSRRYIEQYSGKTAHFGDVDLVLALI